MSDEVKYQTLNIFWGGNSTGGGGAVWGIGYKRWLYQNSAWDTYYGGWDGPEKEKDNLAHELAHALGLNHNFIEKSCDECDDNDPPTTPPCPYKAETNNIMSYWPGSRSAISECQLKKMHWALMGYYGDISAALVDDYCEIINSEMIIDDPGNTVEWLHSVYLKGDLRITPTTTLIIKCLVGMPANGRIIVENGAKLVVDEGYITNMCGELWQGIQVWGVGSSYSHPSVSTIYSGTYPTSATTHHGVVYIKDGSIIEFARNGITTSKYDDFGNAAYRGGIIVAHGGTFLNCKRSAEFMQYDFVPGGYQNIEDDNISEFYSCNFEVNDDYPCDETFYAHVSMWDVDGVNFIGNTFKELRTGCTNNAMGIFSIDATYTVASDYCGGAIPCDYHIGSFEGFFKAIVAENANFRPRDIVVGDNLFTNNYRGILLSNVAPSMLISNTFEVPDNPTTSFNAYGVYLEDCVGYKVENNSFTTYGSYDNASPYNAGIYVVNNSNAVTEVYRNTFEELEAGVRVQTNNSKLQIKCNTFNSVIKKHDIYVTNTGTLGTQGLCLSSAYPCATRVNSPAGNTFSFDCNNSEGEIKIYSGHPELKYRHHNETAYTPTCYTTGATYVTPVGCSYSHNLGAGCIACPSTLPIGGTGFRLDGSAATTSAYDLYNELGNTQELIDDLEAALEFEDNELEYNMEEPSENDDLIYLENQREQLLDDCANLYFLEGKVDSATLILENFDIEGLEQKIVEYEFLSGDYESAELKLNNLNNTSIENSDFKVLYEILIDNAKTGSNILSLDESDLETLESIAGKQSRSGVAAENLLTFLTGAEYEEVFDNENEETDERQIANAKTEVNIYPNPVSDELFIDISSLNEESVYNLMVYDITGKKLFESLIAGNATTSLNTTNIQKGLLLIKITENNQILFTAKIVNE